MENKPFTADPLDALLDGPLASLDDRQKNLISRLIGSPLRKPRVAESDGALMRDEEGGAC